MLTTLNTTNNTLLESLTCRNNRIQSLDLRNNRKLKDLNCDENILSELNVSNNTALAYLSCANNKLTTLDISNNKILMELYCYDNKLTTLDVNNNRSLEQLDCSDNYLTSLDLSNNTSLWLLACDDNNINELNIGNCKRLERLSCCENKIKVLDVTESPLMNELVLHVTPEKYYDDSSDVYNILYEGGNQEEADYLLVDKDVTIIPRSSDAFLIYSNTSKTINVGESIQIIPKDQTAKSYKSSSAKVASVSQSGLVKGLKAGRATITITLTNRKTLKLTLTVIDPTIPTGIKLEQTGTVELHLGKTLQLKASLSPSTAQSKLTWKSSNEKIVAVSSDGVIRGVKKGTAKVTVSTVNNKKAMVTVKVTNPYEPTGISFSEGKELSLEVGKDYMFLLIIGGILDMVELIPMKTVKKSEVSELRLL